MKVHLVKAMVFPVVMYGCEGWTIRKAVQFSCSVVSDSLWPHEPQHTRPPCPSPTPGVHPNPCPSSWWCHPTISSSIVPFSSCPQSFPTSGFFQMSQLFASGGQSISVSASTSAERLMLSNCGVGEDSWESLGRKEIKQVNPKGNQSWIFIERTDAEAEATILQSPDVRTDSLENTQMLGKIEGRRKRRWQRTRLLDGIISSMDMSLSKLQEMVKDWHAGKPGVLESSGSRRVGQDRVTE